MYYKPWSERRITLIELRTGFRTVQRKTYQRAGDEDHSSVKGSKPHYSSGIVVYAHAIFGVIEYATH